MPQFDTIARRLGKTSRSRFIVAYGVAAGVAMGGAMFGGNTGHMVLRWVGGVTAAGLTAILVSVTAWYRGENVVSAAILLALAWTLARMIAVCCAVFLWRSLGGVGFAMLGVLFGLPIAILEAILVGAVLVAMLRGIRPPPPSPPVRESGSPMM